MRQRQRVELDAGLLLDPRRNEIETGPGGSRRRIAGQPFAREAGRSRWRAALLRRSARGGSRLPRTRASVSSARLLRTPAIVRAPSASKRAVSSASKTARASGSTGAADALEAVVVIAEPKRQRIAAPRASATSLRLHRGAGRRDPRGLCPTMAQPRTRRRPRPRGSRAIARAAPARARRNRSMGSAIGVAGLGGHALGQVLAEDALVIFRDQRPLGLVALVEEGQPEGEADVAEDQRVLRPGDHRARAHHGRDVAVDEALAGQVGDLDHLLDRRLAVRVVIFARLGEHDLRLDRGGQVVERRRRCSSGPSGPD